MPEPTWSVPKIDGLAGPDQLADALIDWRAWVAKSLAWDSFFPSSESVRKLLSLSFYASLAQEEGRYPRFRIYVPGLEGLLFELLAMILAEAVESRTGGAFVILPSGDSPFVMCKYRLKDFSLKQLISKFWTACVDLTNASDAPQVRDLARISNAGFRELHTQARAVATLSKTDGCVYLDRSFDIHGFGGKIQVSDDDIAHAGITYAHPSTKGFFPTMTYSRLACGTNRRFDCARPKRTPSPSSFPRTRT
jgi:hypothetical protein